jgi:PhnB protein
MNPMPPQVHYSPQGHNDVSPYLIVKDAARALEFYKQAFGATELFSMPHANGKIMHAEIKIGDTVIMLADEAPEMGARSPDAYGGSPVMLHVYVPDVDARVQQAVAAGAKIVRPVQDEFYGNRSGGLQDPFGHVWHFATQKEILTLEQIAERAAALPKKH